MTRAELADLLTATAPGLGCLLERATRYDILQPDGSPYITRWVLWGRPSLGDTDFEPPTATSCYIHEIHSADSDRHLHDHPWAWAHSTILAGGYTEKRRGHTFQALQYTHYSAGDLVQLRARHWHCIQSVLPGTVTLFLAGPRVQDWGFLVDGHKIPHRAYLAARAENRFTHTQGDPTP